MIEKRMRNGGKWSRGRNWRLEALWMGGWELGYVECKAPERAVEVCRGLDALIRRGGLKGVVARVNWDRVYVGKVGNGVWKWAYGGGVIIKRATSYWTIRDTGGRLQRPQRGMLVVLRGGSRWPWWSPIFRGGE